MATAVLTDDFTVLSTFETDTGSLVREQTQSIQLEGTLFVQLAGSLGGSDDGLGLNGFVSPAFTAVDITGAHVRAWKMTLTTPDTVANGGVRFRYEDGVGTNFGEHFVSGSGTYRGGYRIFAVEANRAFDRTSATAAVKTAITRIGPIANLVRTGIDGSAVLMDAARLGSKMTVTGGTVADPLTLLDIDTADDTLLTADQRGILRKDPYAGPFLLLGGAFIGNTVGTLLTVFKDKNVKIIALDMPVAAGYNNLTIEANATNKTQFTLGTENGTGVESTGFGAGSFSSNATIQARKPDFNSIDADSQLMELFGFTFENINNINLTGAFNRVISPTVTGCKAVVLRTNAMFRGGTVVDSVNTPTTATSNDGAAVDLGTTDPAVDKFKDKSILGNPRGLLFNPAATGNLTLDKITLSGNAVCDNAQQFDSPSTFVSQTADANSVAANDVQFFPTVSVTGDAFILGLKQPGPRVRINGGTAGVGTYTLTPQYRTSPTVWTNLAGVTDGTNNFKTAGENDVTFTVPTNWVLTTEGGEGPFFHMRFLRNAGTMTTNPLGTTCLTGFDIRLVSGTGITTTIKILGGTAITRSGVEHVTAGTFAIENNVVVTIGGVTEGAAIKVIANATVGSVTIGDILLQALADVNGEASFTHNFEGDLAVIVRIRQQGLPNAAISDDNAVFVDETTAANSSTVDDMNLLPAVPVINQDGYLFGHNEQSDSLKLDISTAGVGGGTITWQYSNTATTFANLAGVVDNTSSLSVLGSNKVSWTIPVDWVDATINGQGPFKYIRARFTAGTFTTAPKGRECALNITRFKPFDQNRTIISTGLTVVATWVEDTISTF